jgi:predicted transport protein
MASPEEMARTMRANVPEKTGRSMDAWFAELEASGLEKHGQMVKHLKSEHGVTHGFANLIASDFRSRGEAAAPDPVDAMFEGREGLRPIHDAVIEAVRELGDDVELAPKKSYVSLRRSKQFGMVGPATKSQVEVCLNLKGTDPTDRFKATKGMATHKTRLTAPAEVDSELIEWLRAAYDRA